MLAKKLSPRKIKTIIKYSGFTFFLLLYFLGHAQDLELGTNLGHTAAVNSLRFSPDSKYLVSSADDGLMKIWHVESGSLILTSPEISSKFDGQLYYFPQQNLVSFDAVHATFGAFGSIWDLSDNSLKKAEDIFLQSSNQGLSFNHYLPILEDLMSFYGPDPASPAYNERLKKESSAFTNGYGYEHKGLHPNGVQYYIRSQESLQFFGIWGKQEQTPIVFPGLTENFTFNSSGQYLFGSAQVFSGQEFTIWQLKDGAVHATVELPPDTYLNDVSPDGKSLLVTQKDGQSGIYDLDQRQLQLLFKNANTNIITGNPLIAFDQASYSPDGQYAALGTKDGTIYVYSTASGKLQSKLRSATQVVTTVEFSTDDQFVQYQLRNDKKYTWNLFTGILKPAFEIGLSTATANMEDYLGWSADQRLGYRDGALWDINQNKKIKDLNPVMPSGYSFGKSYISQEGKWMLIKTEANIRDSRRPIILWNIETNEAEWSYNTTMGEEVSAARFSPDSQYLILSLTGGNLLIKSISNSASEEKKIYEAHAETVTSIAFSATRSNQFLTTSSASDGTIKLWDAEKGEAIATLIHVDEEDWVVIGPNGLFDASPNAMELLFYKVYEDGVAEYVELEQLKSRYYEPGLLQKLLGYSDERIRSVEDLGQVALYPEVTTNVEGDQLQVELKERSGGIGRVSIFVNGKEVVNDANPQRQTSFTYDLKPIQKYLLRDPNSTNFISVRAYNEEGWLKSRSIDKEYKPSPTARGSGNNADASSTSSNLAAKMYVVAIGTSDYGGDKMDLQFADQDATLMARALQTVGDKLFGEKGGVEIYCLTTASPDSTGLEETAINWQVANKKNIASTMAEIKKEAKAEDVIVVYFSGHGVTHGSAEQSQFYYLTQDYKSEDNIADSETRNAYTISSEELTSWINDIAALKQVVIVDACNSGKVVQNLLSGTRNLNSSQIRALDRMKDRTGMFILSGSAADKVSYEASEFGQGLLTYALLEGMVGKAIRETADGNYVDVMKLFQHARDEVPRLAASINGIQTPMLGFPTSGASFDIGIFDSEMDIAIGNKKPVVIRSTFINQDPRSMRDDLGLIKLVEDGFREETEKGKNADLIYVNVTDYPGAFYLSGLYTVNKDNGNIKLTANLIKDDQSIPLEIPETNDSEILVRYLMRAVKRNLKSQQGN